MKELQYFVLQPPYPVLSLLGAKLRIFIDL